VWGGKEVSTKNEDNGIKIYQVCKNSTWYIRKTTSNDNLYCEFYYLIDIITNRFES
jgi:hypothetical protein